MTWTRLSDDFPDRPDLLECSRSARLLHIEAMIYANRHGLDGRVPTAALQRISDSPDIDGDLEQLRAGGLWRQLHAGAWQIEGWTDREHQEPAAAVEIRAQAVRDKAAKYRRRFSECNRGNEIVRDYLRVAEDNDGLNFNRFLLAHVELPQVRASRLAQEIDAQLGGPPPWHDPVGEEAIRRVGRERGD